MYSAVLSDVLFNPVEAIIIHVLQDEEIQTLVT